MRKVPSDIASKLAMKKQTRANQADPSASIWIGRPTTALTTDVFLERQTVLTAPVTDTSVAVCHPRFGSGNTKTDLAYISGGKARVVTAPNKAKMSSHVWSDTGFNENASAVSIAYDGTMPKDDRGNVEFVTESMPWIFWVDGGKLYTRKLGLSETAILAEENCTDVSAIRGMWSEVGGFDFGLVVFFLLSGTIYYRQLIDGEWTDAETVTFGPSGVTWTSIAAFRTWDYRVGVQGKTSTGDLYELFTQFMGIGKQTVEHIEIKDVKAIGTLTPIDYHNTKLDEHVGITDISAVGLRQWGLAVYGVNAINVDDGSGNYGLYIAVLLDHPCSTSTITGNVSAFLLKSSTNVVFSPSTIGVSSDGMLITVGFTDFNSAIGDLTISYTPGTISSPPINPDAPMQAWHVTFTPVNLEPPDIDPPEVEAMWNE